MFRITVPIPTSNVLATLPGADRDGEDRETVSADVLFERVEAKVPSRFERARLAV